MDERRYMLPFKLYVKKGYTQMRPYVPGEDLSGVSVSDEDKPPKLGDMIARNASNHNGRWLVAKGYFEAHYEAAPDHPLTGEQSTPEDTPISDIPASP